MRKGSILPIAVMAFAIVAFLLLVDLAISPKSKTSTKNSSLVACTQEAKLCPDGSYVGRSGPKCEFTKCPTTNTNSSSSLKTYSNTDNGLTFQYPADRIVREYSNNFEVRVMDANDPDRDQPRATGAVAGLGDVGIARLSKFYSDPKEYLTSTFNLRAEITTTTVAAETAYRVTYAQPFGASEDDLIIYVFNHAGATWYARLDLTGIAGSADEDFEAMVKSISFTSPTPSTKFENAINTRDYALMEGLLAETVSYSLKATECCGNWAPSQVIQDFKTRLVGEPSFNFSQNQEKIQTIRSLYPHEIIGINTNGRVIFYRLDKNGKVFYLQFGQSLDLYD